MKINSKTKTYSKVVYLMFIMVIFFLEDTHSFRKWIHLADPLLFLPRETTFMISCLFKASKEGSTLKRKNLLPWKEFAPRGANSFLL